MKSLKTEDRRRRLKALKKYPKWPRRIKRAVRQGAICLKMTTEQLLTSWDTPHEKTSGFILGFGDVDIYFFHSPSPIAVVVKNNEVIGWSEKTG